MFDIISSEGNPGSDISCRANATISGLTSQFVNEELADVTVNRSCLPDVFLLFSAMLGIYLYTRHMSHGHLFYRSHEAHSLEKCVLNMDRSGRPPRIELSDLRAIHLTEKEFGRKQSFAHEAAVIAELHRALDLL